MASRSKFQIPSLSDMEEVEKGTVNELEPAFKKHKEVHDDQPASKDTTSAASGNKIISTKTATKTFPFADDSWTGGVQERLCLSSAQEKNLINNITSTDEASQSAETDSQKGSSTSSKLGSSNCLIVNPRQRGNPILKSVRNVPWEYGNIIPDYVMGQCNCALFLSLRYHQLHPNYIHDRLKQLGHSYDLRVILVQVDVKEPHQILKELAKICILADCTLVLAFSPEEAGRYLETYKVFENKPPEAIMEKTEDNFIAKFTDCLTRVKSVNKTDCLTLLTAFGSLADIINSKEEDLSLCPGFGPQKAKRLHSLFHEPFLRNPSKGKIKATESSPVIQSSSSSS